VICKNCIGLQEKLFDMERERDTARVEKHDLRTEVSCLQVREGKLKKEVLYLQKRLKGANDVINYYGQRQIPPPKMFTEPE